MRKAFLIISFFSCIFSIDAQNIFYGTFVQHHAENVSCYSTRDEGMILVSSLDSVNNKDIIVMKLDLNGNQQWTRMFDQTENDFGNTIIETDSNNYIVGGNTREIGSPGSDALIFKLDSAGNILWSYSYSSTLFRSLTVNKIKKSQDGFIVIGSGLIVDSIMEYSDIFILKLDFSGNLYWSLRLGNSNQDVGSEICPTHDGGYLVGVSHLDENISLTKIDSIGTFVWSKNFNAPFIHTINGIAETNFNDIIVVGAPESLPIPDLNGFIMKLDSLGSLAWLRLVGNNTYSGLFSMCLTSDDNILSCGTIAGGVAQSLFVKMDLNGDTLWAHFLQDPNSGASHVSPTMNGGVFVVGMDSLKSYYMKLDSAGFGCVNFYPSVRVRSSSATVTNNSFSRIDYNFFSRNLSNLSTHPGPAVINQCVHLDIDDLPGGNDINIFPNPTTEIFTIRPSDTNKNIHVQILNILGKIVFENEYSSSKEININMGNINEGLYVLRITDGERISSKLIQKIN